MPPLHGDDFIETEEGSLRAALPWSHPIDHGELHTPWNPDQEGKSAFPRWTTPKLGQQKQNQSAHAGLHNV